jgi:hypothetical protein
MALCECAWAAEFSRHVSSAQNQVSSCQESSKNCMAACECQEMHNALFGRFPQSFSLSNCVEPESLVFPELLVGVKVSNHSGVLSEVVSHKVLKLEFPQEANTLRVLP